MSARALQQYKSTIRGFQQRVINRSISQLIFFDKIADKLLDCFTQTKPSTLSFLSFLPLLVLAIFVTSPVSNSLLFGIAALVLFLHQIMDMANKKQAYRLYNFSLATFYIDHMYDALSVNFIVYIVTRLMGFQISTVWIFIFVFGLLPFYITHLRMYYTGYMEFQLFSPPTEGLLFIQLSFLLAMFIPDLFQKQIFTSQITKVYVSALYVFIATAILLYFLLKQFLDIKNGNKNTEEFPLKNLFIIIVTGYIFFQTFTISPHLLGQSRLVFLQLFLINSLNFSIIIGNLVLCYGTGTKFNQISLNTLGVNTFVIAFYTALFFITNQNVEFVIAWIAFLVLVVLELIYFVFYHRKVIKQINQVISQ